MPVKCVTGGLLFRTSNDLDWHIREEHLQRETPPAKDASVAAPAPVVGGTDQADGPPPPAEGGYEPGATAVEPPARPWWRRLFGRRHRNPRRGRVAEAPSARSVPRAAFELRQPADVVLVEMGQHRSSHIGEVIADGLQPGGERIAGGDVEAREAVVEDSGGAAWEVARVGDRRPVLAGVEQDDAVAVLDDMGVDGQRLGPVS
jgi:hypothetical protein